MKRIDIKVGFQCNNHCAFCVQGPKRRFFPDRAKKDIMKILSLSRNEYGEATFTGGEPTIRKDLIDLVRYAAKLGYQIQIQSNGRMFAYKDFCEEMILAGATIFCVSIHGHRAELHDALTQDAGSFKQTRQGIKNLLSLKMRVATNTVINKMNYRFLPAIARFLIELGVPQYQFSFPHILGSALTNADELIPKKKDVIPYLKRGLRLGIAKKKIVRTEAIPYCFLKGYEQCVSEREIPETKIFDAHLTENFTRWRLETGKIKGPRCAECKFFQPCEGPWREYPEMFGWDEFIPVK